MSIFGKREEVAQPTAAPVATASVSKSGGHSYGIGDVIRLLRTLPVDQHAELVVRVIRTTLESVNVHVSDLVEDASRQQQKLGERIATLQGRSKISPSRSTATAVMSCDSKQSSPRRRPPKSGCNTPSRVQREPRRRRPSAQGSSPLQHPRQISPSRPPEAHHGVKG